MNIWIVVKAFAGVIDSLKAFRNKEEAYKHYHKEKENMNLDEDDIEIFSEEV